jgi:hypothetical protein
MAGVISGIPRLPASSSKARINRFNAGVGFKSSDLVDVKGKIKIKIVTSDYTDTTDLPAADSGPGDGQILLLVSADGSRRLCLAYGGIWYEEVLSQMS